MSGPNPIVTSHVLRFQYVQNGLTHSDNRYVTAIVSGDATGYSLDNPDATADPLSDAIDQWEDLVGPVLGLGTTPGTVTLYKNTITGLIPIYSAAIGALAVGGGLTIASELTVFYKDSLNRVQKDTLLEVNFPVPLHYATYDVGVVGAALNALVADTLNNTLGHIGHWSQSRSGKFGPRFISITVGLNRRIRRRRGLA
jgi:hypothetical protein